MKVYKQYNIIGEIIKNNDLSNNILNQPKKLYIMYNEIVKLSHTSRDGNYNYNYIHTRIKLKLCIIICIYNYDCNK